MDSESYELLIPLLKTGVWGLVIIVIVLILRKEIRALIVRITKSDDVQMSLGFLSVQAKTMRELQRSMDVGLPENMIDRQEIEALVETKLKSIQAAMERAVSVAEVRENPRKEVNQKITIRCQDGNMVSGIALDVSEAGIGFKSNGRLRFQEVVEIISDQTDQRLPALMDHVKIVRIEQGKEGYYYGASIVDG